MIIIFVILGIAIFTIIILLNQIQKFKNLYLEEKSKKTSFVVKHGKTMENLVPWIKEFPGDPRKFRFIGDPIDGILFGEEEITFFEFKSGKSSLSQTQKKIRDIVKDKKIKWKEIRISQ